MIRLEVLKLSTAQTPFKKYFIFFWRLWVCFSKYKIFFKRYFKKTVSAPLYFDWTLNWNIARGVVDSKKNAQYCWFTAEILLSRLKMGFIYTMLHCCIIKVLWIINLNGKKVLSTAEIFHSYLLHLIYVWRSFREKNLR